jgi:hypothetical protein
MIQITFKAKHFYFITFLLKNSSIQQYFSLISRIKTALTDNTDLDASFTIQATPDDIILIYKILTSLPEGQSNSINTEMSQLLEPQVQAGYVFEVANGLVPDAEGNIPPTAYWHKIAAEITYVRNNNIQARNNAIAEGQSIIDSI